MRRIFACICIIIGCIHCCIAWAQVWPNSGWRHIAPDQVQIDGTRLQEAADYALTGGGAGMIVRGGYVVHSWGDQTTRFDLKSTTKSIGGTALGLALADNMLLLTDAAQQHLPGFGLPPQIRPPAGSMTLRSSISQRTRRDSVKKAAMVPCSSLLERGGHIQTKA